MEYDRQTRSWRRRLLVGREGGRIGGGRRDNMHLNFNKL